MHEIAIVKTRLRSEPGAGQRPRRQHFRILVTLLCCIAGATSRAVEAVIVTVGDRNLAVKRLGQIGPIVAFESGQGLGSWDRVTASLARAHALSSTTGLAWAAVRRAPETSRCWPAKWPIAWHCC